MKQVRVGPVLLHEDDLFLEHFPVRDFKIENADGSMYEIEPDNGILYTALPPNNYSYTYEVGFEDGQLPAIVKELIEGLIVGVDEDTVQALVRMIRLDYEKRDKFRKTLI